MENSVHNADRPTTWHIYWQAALGRDLLLRPELAERIRNRLLAAHDVGGRKLLYYLLMPREIHLISILRPEDSTASFATGVSNVIGKWVREADGAFGPVFADRYQAQRVDTVEALRSEVRMLAWRPVAAGLQALPTNYANSALRAILGLCLPNGFHATALFDWLGGSVPQERTALQRALAVEPSNLEIVRWELVKGLVSARGTVGPSGPMARRVRGASAGLVAASRDRSVDGALKLLERWVEVKLGLHGGHGLSSRKGMEGARGRALVANLAMRSGLCSAACVARHYGRAKATLSEQMTASSARAADQAILSIPMEQIVREAIALATHPAVGGGGGGGGGGR